MEVFIMLYVDFPVGDMNYRLRLTTRAIVALEKQLGCNPLAIFGNSETQTLPPITSMVQILHASLQAYEHGITLDKAYEIFDKYLEKHSMTDFLPVILDIYRVSGIIGKEEADTEKN
jgi:hypothetical protein